MSTTPSNGIPYVPENTLDPAAGLNLALDVIDPRLQLAVLGVANDPPADPTDGDRWIVGAAPTGAWTGEAGQIARWRVDGEYWQFFTGRYALNMGDGVLYTYDGAVWSDPLASAGATLFLELNDTPSAYTDQAGRALRVNATVDGLEYFDAALAVHTHVVGDIEDTGGLEGQVPTINSVGEVVWADPPGATGGEANTASNRGTGEGVFAAKSGVDLEFKSLAAGSGVTLSSDANEITITADGGGSSELEVSTEAVTAYTLVAADAGKYLRMDHADPNTVTVPDDATLDFPVGTQVHVRQAGAGQTSVAGATGVTIHTAETLSLNKQHSTATLVKVAADTWDLMGDLEASA